MVGRQQTQSITRLERCGCAPGGGGGGAIPAGGMGDGGVAAAGAGGGTADMRGKTPCQRQFAAGLYPAGASFTLHSLLPATVGLCPLFVDIHTDGSHPPGFGAGMGQLRVKVKSLCWATASVHQRKIQQSALATTVSPTKST
eukprot:1160774-Pelagomonas_calceolata.AAC.4